MVALDKIEAPQGNKIVGGESFESKLTTDCGNCFAVNCREKCGELVLVSLQGVNPKEAHNVGGNPTTLPRKRNFIVQYFKKKSQTWNRNQFVTITVLSFVEFFAAAVISIQAPFYPDVVRNQKSYYSIYLRIKLQIKELICNCTGKQKRC